MVPGGDCAALCRAVDLLQPQRLPADQEGTKLPPHTLTHILTRYVANPSYLSILKNFVIFLRNLLDVTIFRGL